LVIRWLRVNRQHVWWKVALVAGVIGSGVLLARVAAHQAAAPRVVSLGVPPPVVVSPTVYEGLSPEPVGDVPPSLVLIQGLKARRLVVVPLDGSPAVDVDQPVMTWPLLPSPDGAQVLYSTEHTVMALDMADRRASIVGTLPDGGRFVVGQWSPDARSVAYVAQTADSLVAY